MAGLALALTPASNGPAAAQLLGGGLSGLPVGGMGDLPGAVRDLPGAGRSAVVETLGAIDRTTREATGALDAVRRATVRSLLRDHADVVEADDRGQPVVRGEILGLGVTPEALSRLQAQGFVVRAQGEMSGLGLSFVTLGLPRRMSAVEAVRELHRLDPTGQYEFDHLYQLSGAAQTGPGGGGQAAGADGRGLRIGMVDGAAAASRPTLATTPMVQRAFATGGGRPTAHATAVASLIAGSGGGVRGAAAGATLYIADVYGTTPTGGSAQAVVRALDWLAQQQVAVISISLVGPPNLLLGRAVDTLTQRGVLLVAAVGNDGPAAAPLYPAAYPGVIAVTGVDNRRRVLPEAGRGGHVDFAALGADVTVAGLRGGLARVRGTSFAAPVVAGRLARLLRTPEKGAATRAVDALARSAIDLGAPGADPIYGRGLVGP